MKYLIIALMCIFSYTLFADSDEEITSPAGRLCLPKFKQCMNAGFDEMYCEINFDDCAGQ